jgi:hypothetical protein
MDVVSTAPECRSCKEESLLEFLAPGPIPLTNAYAKRRRREPEPRYALDLAVCPRCSLVPIPSRPAEEIFEPYSYTPRSRKPSCSIPASTCGH